MLIFCAIATPRPRAPTSCNPFVRRSSVASTPTRPHLSLALHNSKHGRTRSRSGTRATSTTHPSCNMRCTSTSRANAIAAGAHRATGPQLPLCQHCCQHVATATCLARHAAPHLAAPCCAWAARPLLRFVQDAAESKCSPGPPGRLRLRCVCVCVCVCVGVLGDVMSQCRSMRRLFSGQLPSAVRLFQFLLVWPLLCVRYRFRFGCSCGSLLAHYLLTPRTAHTHTSHNTQTTHTPRTLHTPHIHRTPIHTTPLLLTTHNHPHHSHHYTRSCSRKLEMAFSLGCAS